MRRVIYSVAMSLDGFIAGPGGEYDWIPDEDGIDWGPFMARFDTVLMGRGTWELVQGQGEAAPHAGLDTYVFSTTLGPADHPDVTVVGEGAADVVAGLRAGEGKDIWLLGGGVLFRSLLDAGQVDVVEVGLIPVLLGQGIPFLPPGPGGAKLALSKTKEYPSGIVMLEYQVVRDSP